VPGIIDRQLAAPLHGSLKLTTTLYGDKELITGTTVSGQFTNGQIAHVQYDARSLPDFLDSYQPIKDFSNDEFEAVQVSLSVEYTDDDTGYHCSGYEDHDVVRFISAALPGTNKVPMGLAPPFRTHDIDSSILASVIIGPTISIDASSGNPSAFSTDGNTLTFKPSDPKYLNSYFVNLAVAVNGTQIGTLNASATCLIRRTWGLNAAELQSEMLC
jgi:hypothetical protein